MDVCRSRFYFVTDRPFVLFILSSSTILGCFTDQTVLFFGAGQTHLCIYSPLFVFPIRSKLGNLNLCVPKNLCSVDTRATKQGVGLSLLPCCRCLSILSLCRCINFHKVVTRSNAFFLVLIGHRLTPRFFLNSIPTGRKKSV